MAANPWRFDLALSGVTSLNIKRFQLTASLIRSLWNLLWIWVRIKSKDSIECFLSSLFPFKTVMQPTDSGQLDQLSSLARPGLDRTFCGSVFAKSIMSSVAMIIFKVRGQHPFQVVRVQYDHVIKTIPANWIDQSFNERILPWTSERFNHFVYAHAFQALTENRSVDSVPIPQ